MTVVISTTISCHRNMKQLMRLKVCWQISQWVSMTTGSKIPGDPLLASCVPLSAVVPSLLTNSLKLLSSLLLLSEKFWLCTIFSTMSSASIRVSSTQLGCLSTVSFFLLEDLLDLRAAAEGGGGLSGLVGVAGWCGEVGVEGGGWEGWAWPQEALLLEEAFLWWLRSVRLEQREWLVLYPDILLCWLA